ncbi:MAG TPA: hypothetical protein VJU80_09020 [Solirubrobacteraceae bacterium]|nr:hypothetical protein [Solirubrobacteraceae bacterium]
MSPDDPRAWYFVADWDQTEDLGALEPLSEPCPACPLPADVPAGECCHDEGAS